MVKKNAKKKTTGKDSMHTRAKVTKNEAKRPKPSAKSSPAKKQSKTVLKTSPGAKPTAKKREKASSRKRSPSKSEKLTANTLRPERVERRGKILPKQFVFDLAQTIRDAVVPAIMAGKGREIVGTSPSGDATFELDRIAEKALLIFLKNARKPVAYYSEESGYTTFSSGQPTHLLVVDPIDGTRAARSGFEYCVVTVSSTRVIERPTVADLDNACILEILGDRSFYAEYGKGARVYSDGHLKKTRLSQNTDLESVSWSMTVPARPAELIFPTAARFIDLTSLKGGFFACNSTSYSLMRLLTGQLDACVDFANRFYRDIPEIVEDQFLNAGRGVVLGVCPYDYAGALLIAEEAGCIVTDAYGKRFHEVLLLDSSVSSHRSVIASSNAALHGKLLNYFNTRIEQLETLLKKRHANAKASSTPAK